MITVTKLTQTCEACPSQWEGYTDDDRAVYIRYRWGYLSVSVSEPGDLDVMHAVSGTEVFGRDIGGGLSGSMDFDGLKAATEGHVKFDV